MIFKIQAENDEKTFFYVDSCDISRFGYMADIHAEGQYRPYLEINSGSRIWISEEQYKELLAFYMGYKYETKE